MTRRSPPVRSRRFRPLPQPIGRNRIRCALMATGRARIPSRARTVLLLLQRTRHRQRRQPPCGDALNERVRGRMSMSRIALALICAVFAALTADPEPAMAQQKPAVADRTLGMALTAARVSIGGNLEEGVGAISAALAEPGALSGVVRAGRIHQLFSLGDRDRLRRLRRGCDGADWSRCKRRSRCDNRSQRRPEQHPVQSAGVLFEVIPSTVARARVVSRHFPRDAGSKDARRQIEIDDAVGDRDVSITMSLRSTIRRTSA